MGGEHQDPRWQKRRLEIMQIDGFACVACLDASSTLHVHHKRYKGKLWESPDEDLQTLCESCHFALGKHPKSGIYWVRGERADSKPFIVIETCPQCGRDFVESCPVHGIVCHQCEWRFAPQHQVLFRTMDYWPGTGDA
jgi:hypothetical protein